MKNSLKLSIFLSYLLILVSCTTDSPSYRQGTPPPNTDGNGSPPPTEGNNNEILNFGFLDGSSNTYLEMPIESSPTQLFIGRWKITKFGIDENNNGKIKYKNYQDFEHKSCGLSFLQFNNDGVVFENNYYKNNNVCILYSIMVNWVIIEENRFNINGYDFIFLVKASQSELILKYDWGYTDWAPMQTYYYYERIQPTN